MMTKLKTTQNYVDGVKFSKAVVEHNNNMKEWEKLSEEEKQTKPKPKVSNYIGEQLLKIADNYYRKACFVKYPWIDEAKSYGIELALKYIHNYDENKSFTLNDLITQHGEKTGTKKYNVRQERLKGKKETTKTAGAFSYITTYFWNSFLQKLKEEEIQKYAKYSAMHTLHSELDYEAEIEDVDGTIIKFSLHENLIDFIDEFDSRLKEQEIKKERKKLQAKLEPKLSDFLFE